MERLSVIIPTLNESAVLPDLLGALQQQTRPPDEVIVSDSGSRDGTVDLARAAGATVLVGRWAGPGAGRNDGARLAVGDVLLFLDADVLPPATFLADAMREFVRCGYVAAACPLEGLSRSPVNRFLAEMSSWYMIALQSVSPRAPGWCIFVRREVHRAIDGFDESVRLGEDHDYVRRAARHGRFGVLRSVRIPVSMRRLEEDSRVRLALNYVWTEAHAFAGKPVRRVPFEYEFGAHRPMPADHRSLGTPPPSPPPRAPS